MKPVFASSLALVLGLGLLIPTAAAHQQEPRKGAKKVDAKELLRQKMEAYADADKARKNYKAWSSTITWTLSDPYQDRTSFAGGGVKVLEVDNDEHVLMWAVKESLDPNGRKTTSSSRSLLEGGRLRETYEPKRGTKTVYEYNVATIRDYLPQMLIRDGFNKGMEKIFDVEIVANARYMKTEPNEDDWTALGFKGKEDYENWWKKKKATIGGKESKLSEDRPFASKEDKFDRNNPRNKPMKSGGDSWGKFYIIVLRPKIPVLQQRIRSIRLTLRPGDFLPISLIFEHSTDRYRNIKFDNIQKDPEPEITKQQFTMNTDGFRVIRR